MGSLARPRASLAAAPAALTTALGRRPLVLPPDSATIGTASGGYSFDFWPLGLGPAARKPISQSLAALEGAFSEKCVLNGCRQFRSMYRLAWPHLGLHPGCAVQRSPHLERAKTGT